MTVLNSCTHFTHEPMVLNCSKKGGTSLSLFKLVTATIALALLVVSSVESFSLRSGSVSSTRISSSAHSSPLFFCRRNQRSMSLRHRGNKKNIEFPVFAEGDGISTVDVNIQDLVEENQKLRAKIKTMQEANTALEHIDSPKRIVIETFEGENKMEEKWCDEVELEDGCCPIEPTLSFREALRDRAYWLVGLLVMQSCSSFFLARNEDLLTSYPTIVYFLTMLVGAGGNAGNQASVRVIRGLALGAVNDKTQQQFINREIRMALALSGILSAAGFLRAVFFKTPLPETVAITLALFIIVLISVCLGAVLPLLLKRIGVDPAHSSTTIQVVMDILGVIITVATSTFILESPLGKAAMTKIMSTAT